jgi:hypothetical protein
MNDNYLNKFIKARDACSERGYHRITRETEGDEPMICYDCDLWFTKELAKESGIEFKVESLLIK